MSRNIPDARSATVLLENGGRIVIPRTIRSYYGKPREGTCFILLDHMNRGLFFFTMKDLESYIKQLTDKFPSVKRQMIEDYILSEKIEVTFDARGRVILPSSCIKAAKLKRQVFLWSGPEYLVIEAPETKMTRNTSVREALSSLEKRGD